MKTIVLKCDCKSEFQDETYGNKMRLHNVSGNGEKAFCTVCVGSGKSAKMASKSSPPTTNRAYKEIRKKFHETRPIEVK